MLKGLLFWGTSVSATVESFESESKKWLPSGELTFCHGKIHHAIFMGKSTISTGPFSIAFCRFTRPGMKIGYPKGTPQSWSCSSSEMVQAVGPHGQPKVTSPTLEARPRGPVEFPTVKAMKGTKEGPIPEIPSACDRQKMGWPTLFVSPITW